jgi:outer membrane protein OmpA-like peptidoglycan-associated protein
MITEQGISASRIIETRGFADRFMIIPTRKPEPRNRRVEIRIVFVE